ncbi:MAG: DUF1905 domain-containing protein [Chloroflexota bacterium]
MLSKSKFTSTLFKYPGKGGWTFAPVPAEYAPEKTYGWGRTPVTATVDGQTWDTSVWKDTKSGKTLLAVPKKIRNGKGDGDTVEVSIKLREP